MTDKLREASQQALEAIERACHTAMTQTLKARIPECGEFAGIAQDLDFVINALRAALAQQDAQAVPQGWKLVPVEPTPEMERAAFNELELPGTATENGTSMRNRVYRAMLAAAPQPSADVVPGMDEFLADLSRSRTKYPNNARMWDGLMGEVDELRRAYAGDGDQQAEAFDVAVCAFRIATEGDAGGNTKLVERAASQPSAEPLPCPFCGGKPVIGNNRHTATKEGHHIQEIVKWETWINCPHCRFAISSGCIDVASRGNAVAHQETLERAMQMWNTRAPLAQQDAQAVPNSILHEVVTLLEDAVNDHVEGGHEPSEWLGFSQAAISKVRAMLAAPTPPAQQGEEFWPAPLSEFKEGQWWIAELDAIASSVNATDEQKRAVSVVHHFLASAEKSVAAPPAQRVTLTPEEITEVIVDCYGYSADIEFHECLARAVIEAYERKNGIK